MHPSTLRTDILIYGGGAGGVCAAIQAARLGAGVLVVEPSAWLGGMLTAAGVSALDGNEGGAGSGLVREFRDGLIAHYGSADALFTGWISRTCYEPHVGHAVLQRLVRPLSNLTVWYRSEAVRYERADERRRRVTVENASGERRAVECAVFVDATEYGDGLALAGAPYRLGRESHDELGESAAPEVADGEMQDLTYAATLVRRPGVAPLPATPEERALWESFACSTAADCPDPDPQRLNHNVHDWDSFISYAALPNEKYLLNWPHHANDFPVTPRFFEDRTYRRRCLQAAKKRTRAFVKYVHEKLGHPEWQLAEDEYPTDDGLPLLPYIRESRRLVNGQIMTQQDVVPKEKNPRAPVIPDSIAVGDYFLDHHHAKAHRPPGERLVEDYPDNAPFQMPIGVFLPDHGDEALLAGEKNIAVSHIVNGCTRLQPVVMLMGQALGVLAALAVEQNRAPADVDVRAVQGKLLDAGCQLYLAYDVPADHPLFRPVQELALAGVLQADDPLHLEPDEPITDAQAERWARRAGLDAEALRQRLPTGKDAARGAFLQALHAPGAAAE